jgi:hypothetical protein
MTHSNLSLALQIAQLIAENTERELRSAINLLQAHGVGSDLLQFLAHHNTGSAAPKGNANSANTRPSLEGTTSLAVLQLREKDPEKYRLLYEFDKIVRRGEVLATHENLKRFGEKISKDFQPRKSRKDTIGHLLSIMSERPLGDIEKLVEFAASFDVAGNTDQYQRLAQFLIKGKPQSD